MFRIHEQYPGCQCLDTHVNHTVCFYRLHALKTAHFRNFESLIILGELIEIEFLVEYDVTGVASAEAWTESCNRPIVRGGAAPCNDCPATGTVVDGHEDIVADDDTATVEPVGVEDMA
jgi:hypothetical protein